MERQESFKILATVDKNKRVRVPGEVLKLLGTKIYFHYCLNDGDIHITKADD